MFLLLFGILSVRYFLCLYRVLETIDILLINSTQFTPVLFCKIPILITAVDQFRASRVHKLQSIPFTLYKSIETEIISIDIENLSNKYPFTSQKPTTVLKSPISWCTRGITTKGIRQGANKTGMDQKV